MFQRAMVDVMTGARHAHELAQVLATEAVEMTLARVASDYPLDYSTLVQKYRDEVVAACCKEFDAPRETDACAATTKGGKPCGRHAVGAGFCARHLETWQKQRAAQRRAEQYAASLAAASPDPYMEELRRASAKHSVSMALPTPATVARVL